jgi:hypothetical protein
LSISRSIISTRHCASAATMPTSASVGRPSQMRSSTVPYVGCGRMSHHTSLMEAIVSVRISVSM